MINDRMGAYVILLSLYTIHCRGSSQTKRYQQITFHPISKLIYRQVTFWLVVIAFCLSNSNLRPYRLLVMQSKSNCRDQSITKKMSINYVYMTCHKQSTHLSYNGKHRCQTCEIKLQNQQNQKGGHSIVISEQWQ